MIGMGHRKVHVIPDQIAVKLRIKYERQRARAKDPLAGWKILDTCQRWLDRWARRHGHHPFASVKVERKHEPARLIQDPSFVMRIWTKPYDYYVASIWAVKDADPDLKLPRRIPADWYHGFDWLQYNDEERAWILR